MKRSSIVAGNEQRQARPPFARATLHSQIAEELRTMIVDGKLAPGQKIPEKELCEAFDISRTPLREALKVLATEGLVELLPQRGARVSVITEAERQELFPIIAALEALAAELACRNMTDAELAELKGLHRQMVAAYDRRDNLEYARLNRKIHLSIFEAARNGALQMLYSNMELRIRNIRHTVRQSDEDWARAVQDHEKILSALEARDEGLCARVLRDHVMRTADAVRDALSVAGLATSGGT
ncbi:GntR family transcriptional regulator [Paracoccus acridae]|uniref:GntR family transcriptional regulator n=1 Tax=Paracoccus acridae TaxID=1795310 RepID=UPI001E4D20A7|nr:GntR family transcriptional regulator [Paracoccus acridae]